MQGSDMLRLNFHGRWPAHTLPASLCREFNSYTLKWARKWYNFSDSSCRNFYLSFSAFATPLHFSSVGLSRGVQFSKPSSFQKILDCCFDCVAQLRHKICITVEDKDPNMLWLMDPRLSMIRWIRQLINSDGRWHLFQAPAPPCYNGFRVFILRLEPI